MIVCNEITAMNFDDLKRSGVLMIGTDIDMGIKQIKKRLDFGVNNEHE